MNYLFVTPSGKSSVVARGWLGWSMAQLCKGLSKRERMHTGLLQIHMAFCDYPPTAEVHLAPSLLRPSHRIYSLGFQEGSALSSCPQGTNLTGATGYGAFPKIHLNT